MSHSPGPTCTHGTPPSADGSATGRNTQRQVGPSRSFFGLNDFSIATSATSLAMRFWCQEVRKRTQRPRLNAENRIRRATESLRFLVILQIRPCYPLLASEFSCLHRLVPPRLSVSMSPPPLVDLMNRQLATNVAFSLSMLAQILTAF